MLTTLIRRELLDNLMTFRFAAAVLIMLLLVVATTTVLIKDYEGRLASYNTAVKKHRQEMLDKTTYSAADLTIDRPPNPLSIFNVGLDKRLGNTLGVSYFFVPTLWDAGKHGANNPFLNLFSSIDLVFIFQGILSLLALRLCLRYTCGRTRTWHVTTRPNTSCSARSNPICQIH